MLSLMRITTQTSSRTPLIHPRSQVDVLPRRRAGETHASAPQREFTSYGLPHFCAYWFVLRMAMFPRDALRNTRERISCRAVHPPEGSPHHWSVHDVLGFEFGSNASPLTGFPKIHRFCAVLACGSGLGRCHTRIQNRQAPGMAAGDRTSALHRPQRNQEEPYRTLHIAQVPGGHQLRVERAQPLRIPRPGASAPDLETKRTSMHALLMRGTTHRAGVCLHGLLHPSMSA